MKVMTIKLRRKGITLSSPVDCCIAEIAIESNILLLHKDDDFERYQLIWTALSVVAVLQYGFLPLALPN